MFELISDIGFTVFSNVIQLVFGCILSIPVYYFCEGKLIGSKTIFQRDILIIALFSAAGMVLPLNTYGIIPIFIASLAVGFRLYTVLPLLISNTVFNMLIPYTDVSFIWRTGIRRVILAFAAAVLAGIILRAVKHGNEGLLNLNNISNLTEKQAKNINILRMAGRNINIVGIYLIVGVIVNTIYYKYIWWYILNLLNENPSTGFMLSVLTGYNVVNPFFLLTITIVFVLMDFIKLSALLIIIKPKGLVIYYIYFTAIAILLGTSAFFKNI